MQKFFIKKFFNPANGPSDGTDRMAEQPEKVKTTADLMKDFPKDESGQIEYTDAKDKGLNAGEQPKINELNAVGKNVEQHNEHRDDVQKGVDDQIAHPETPADLKQDLQNKVQEHEQAKQELKNETIQRVEYEKKDKIKLTWEGDRLSTETVIDLISDLDNDGGVERENRSFWRRIFGSKDAQTFQVAEQQLKNALVGMDMNQIDDIYRRITGKSDSLQLTKSDLKKETITRSTKEKDYTYVVEKLDTKKIQEFQNDLLDQVAIVNTLGKVMIDSSYSVGLETVLKGGLDKVKEAFNDPERVKKLQEYIASTPNVQERKNIGLKILEVATKIGISGTVSILSGGLLNVGMSQEEVKTLDTKPDKNGKLKTENNFSLENMSARKIIGKNGGSAVLDFDLLGVTGELNWHDQRARVDAMQKHFQLTPDKQQATLEIIKLVESGMSKLTEGKQLTGEEKAKNEAIARLSSLYMREQKILLENRINDPDTQARLQENLMNNTKLYAARVQEIEGLKLKGVYANIALNGLTAGVSFNKMEVTANAKGVSEGGAQMEADILGAKEINEKQAEIYLKEAGIQKIDKNTYIIDGKQVVVPEGKNIQFSFNRLLHPTYKVTTATYEIVNTTETRSTVVSIDLQNSDQVDEFLRNHSRDVAKLLKEIRGNMVDVQENISDGKYSEAFSQLQNKLEAVFKNPKSKQREVISGVLSYMESIDKDKDDVKKKVFLEGVLEKTSGGNLSRELAADLESGKKNEVQVRKDILSYYNGTAKQPSVAKAFAEQYGITKEQVMDLAQSLTNNIAKGTRTTIGEFSKNFQAMVAYSQINNGKQGFKSLNLINNTSTQIAGQPVEVSDPNVAKQIRDIMKSKIKDEMIQKLQESHPDLANKTPDEIKDLITGGSVKAYMSYSEHAECFNLGFFVEPKSFEKTETITNEAKNTAKTGSTLNNQQVTNNTFRVGVGKKLHKKEDKPETKPEPKPVDQQTHTGSKVAENVPKTGIDTAQTVTGEAGGGEILKHIQEVAKGAASDVAKNAANGVANDVANAAGNAGANLEW